MAYPGQFPPPAAATHQPVLNIDTYKDGELREYLFSTIQRVDSAGLAALFLTGRSSKIPMQVFHLAYKVAQNIYTETPTHDSKVILQILANFLALHNFKKPFSAAQDSHTPKRVPLELNEDDLPDAASEVESDPLYDYSDDELVGLILGYVENLNSDAIEQCISSKRIANLPWASIRTLLEKMNRNLEEGAVRRLVKTLEKLLKIKEQAEEYHVPSSTSLAVAAPVGAEE